MGAGEEYYKHPIVCKKVSCIVLMYIGSDAKIEDLCSHKIVFLMCYHKLNIPN